MANNTPAAAHTVETGGNVHGFATWDAAWAFVEHLDAAGVTDWSIGSDNDQLTGEQTECWIADMQATHRPNGKAAMGSTFL